MKVRPKYRPYSRMTRDQLAARLAYRVLKGQISQEERAFIMRKYEPQLTKKEEHGNAKRAWKALLTPLKREIASVNSGINYYTKKLQAERTQFPPDHEDAHVAAYRAYYAYLITLRDRFQAARKRGTLSDLKAEYKKTYALPNNGEHWVDWVRPAAKERILHLFARITPTPGVKHRDPFTRRGTTSVRGAGENSHPDGENSPYQVDKEIITHDE